MGLRRTFVYMFDLCNNNHNKITSGVIPLKISTISKAIITYHHVTYHSCFRPLNELTILCSTTANNQSFLKLQITKLQPKHGFSSFKFIPGTNDEAIVALKTTEFEGKTATYISAFKTNSQVLMEDTKIEDLKYEGLEFI